MSWVFEHSRSKKNARLVLLAIADHAHDDGSGAHPSMPKLQHKTGLSERAVTGLVADLEKAGELEVKRNAGPKGCNLYRVLMIPAESATPAEPAPPQNLHPPGNPDTESSQAASSTSDTPAESAPPQETTGTPAESAPVTIQEPSNKKKRTSSSSAKPPKAKPDPPPDRPDVERICAHLADRIEANGSLRPEIGKRWRDSARLMIDKDGRTEEHIHRAIDWCQNNEFWRGNILSMPKLREQYDQLRLQAMRANGRASPPRASPLVEHNGMLLKPETVANFERRKRFEAMDAETPALEGPT